jgi:urea transporter
MGGLMKKNLTIYFEELSQVLFFRNMYFGILFLFVSIALNPNLFLCGFGSSLVGFIYSRLYQVPKNLKYGGLLTINGLFFGIAMASLFAKTPQFYALLAIGAFAIPVATKASYEVLQHWKLSPFIFAYILVVWALFLCAHTFGFQLIHENEVLKDSTLALNDISVDESSWGIAGHLIYSVFKGLGRSFFLPNALYGLALFSIVSAFSPRRGIFLLAGTGIATLGAFFLASDPALIEDYAHVSYCAGFVGIGLAASEEKINFSSILLFCLLSLFVTMATEQLLKPIGLPLLSLPYVVTLWFALLSRSPRLNISWA